MQNKVKIIQKSSTIGRPKLQQKILLGLGLKKIGNSRVLEDTSAVRGMINKVKHLVFVEKVEN